LLFSGGARERLQPCRRTATRVITTRSVGNGYKKGTKNTNDLVKLLRRGIKNDRLFAKQTNASNVSGPASSTQHARKFECRCAKTVQTLSPASSQ
jgi:hypothetical protein